MEPRTIWLVTHNGTPVAWKWALVRTPAEVDLRALPPNVRAAQVSDERKRSWAAALNAEQAADPAYDATPSQWRRVPLVAQRGHLEHGSPRVEGRAVLCNGVRLRLDDRGRPHPSEGAEPMEPDAEIIDESALIAAAERMGSPLDLVERGTQRRIRVLNERSQGARDADLSKPGVRVLVRSQDGKSVSRIDPVAEPVS